MKTPNASCGSTSEHWMVEERPPSPGTPGEGKGEGSLSETSNLRSQITEGPHPDPRPEYRERGKEGTQCSILPALRSRALIFCAAVFFSTSAFAGEWKAGLARAKITPREPIWMSGYAARDKPAEGTLHDLWAKALALDDGQGHRAVIVTMDLCGIDRDLSQRVCRRLTESHGLDRAAIALCVSHTHTGPVVGSNLRPMYFLDERQRTLVDQYTRFLEDQVIAAAGKALGAMKPARLEYGVGRSTFAVNRRANREQDVTRLRAEGQLKGPFDHAMPVLAVRPARGDGTLAVVFGYACHATTLSFYQWSGDWPGFAQIELEKMFPGSTALFVAGCGADQNPLPRRTVQLAEDYGRQAASAVDATIKAGLRPINGQLKTQYREIDLPFASLPTREQLAKDAQAKDRHIAHRAKLLLSQWDLDGGLAPTYPYPVQAWRFGDDVLLVLLGGEVVVDYSLRLKQELGSGGTWVAGYSNDVMAYIPSRRVLGEGGYEGGGAMVYYGLPSPWAPQVEDQIVQEVHRLANDLRAGVSGNSPIKNPR
jgi:neutral ceramidase